MPPLVAQLDTACPGYVPDPGDAGLAYMWMGGFIGHVIAAHRAGRTDQVRAVFDVIEQTIAGGGKDKELAVVGFLEDLQNTNLHPVGSDPAQFESYLGQESRKMWDQLNGFWHAAVASKGQRER